MKIGTLIKAVEVLEKRAMTRPLNPKETRQMTNIGEKTLSRIFSVPLGATVGKPAKLGQHKLPRYMYHVTTEEAYKKMLQDGFIAPTKCFDAPSGIFLFDLKNFTQFWKRCKDVAEQPRTSLLSWIAEKSSAQKSKIVMLKIPTEKLDAKTLRVRVQKRCRGGNIFTCKEPAVALNDPHSKSKALRGLEYIMQGEGVQNVPLHNQRKNAIEFITPNKISMQDVSLVGTTEIDTSILYQANQNMKDLPEIWQALTAGKPEQKAFLHMTA